MIETNKNFAKLNSITKENLELKKELEYYKAKTADIKEFENINEELKRTYNELAKNNSITKENFELKKEIEYYKLKTVDIKEVENMNEELKRTYNELEKNKNKVGILKNECDQLYKELNNTQLKYQNTIKTQENCDEIKQKYEKNNEKSQKKIIQNVKNELKKKYKAKEEKLKIEINNTIEDIQKNLQQKNAEYAKIKKELLISQEKNKTFEGLQEKNEKTLAIQAEKLEENDKLIEFLKEKLGITENSLKVEIEKFSNLTKSLEVEKNNAAVTISLLNKKINEKSAQINALSKEISELEKKNASKFDEFLEKEKYFHSNINKLQDTNAVESSKLKAIIQELNNDIYSKDNIIKELEEKIKQKIKDFEQINSEKKALEQSISDLEISLKHLDIQQTRQSLEELNILKQKFAQENQNRLNFEEKFKEVQKSNEILQKRLQQDSQFFKMETSRKDTDLIKLKNFLESKLKEKDAEYAIKYEEVRIELVGILGELLSNEISLECCETLEKLILDLS